MPKLRAIIGTGAALGFLLFAGYVSADDNDPGRNWGNIRREHRELHGDRKDFGQDSSELRTARQKLRDDIKNGASRDQIASDRAAIRARTTHVHREKHELSGDRRDLNSDRREFHRDLQQHDSDR